MTPVNTETSHTIVDQNFKSPCLTLLKRCRVLPPTTQKVKDTQLCLMFNKRLLRTPKKSSLSDMREL